MRIERVEAIPVALPFRERYRTASGELDARAMVVLRIDAGGQTGHGEAVPLSLRGGPGPERIAAELERCAELLIAAEPRAEPADADQARSWVERALEPCRAIAGRGALGALDVALHDLAGRLAGLPVWELLGAAAARPVHCNASIDAAAPDEAAAAARMLVGEGFETLKVKVGTGADEERLTASRDTAGPEVRLRIDANGAFTPDRALELLERLSDLGLELVEQPCRDLDGLAAVREAAGLPVIADESVASLSDAEAALASGACDAATLKLAKVGGPLEALRIGAAIPSYLSSALDGPIGIAAAAHTAQALPERAPASGFAQGLATLAMFAECYAPIDALYGPTITPGEGPGLAVEPDPAALEELRLR